MTAESKVAVQDGEAANPLSMGKGIRTTAKALTDKQLRAAELLVAGISPGIVAKDVGLSREQFWRWRTQDPAFMHHVERLRIELHESRVDRIWTLVDSALRVVGDSLEEGDPQIAMQLLRLPGLHLSDADVRANGGDESYGSKELMA